MMPAKKVKNTAASRKILYRSRKKSRRRLFRRAGGAARAASDLPKCKMGGPRSEFVRGDRTTSKTELCRVAAQVLLRWNQRKVTRCPRQGKMLVGRPSMSWWLFSPRQARPG